MSRWGAAVVLALGLAACGGSSPVSTHARPVQTTHTSTTKVTLATQPPPAPQPKPKAKPKPKPNPGSLPQTNQLPSPHTAAFRTEMSALWRGVKANSVAKAMRAFFPEAAYLQVKAIGDPQADYTGRLVGDYRFDLGAAHALLGADPRSAQLVGVKVPQGYAHWVPPDVCANRVGYYEVPNARVVYRQNGSIHSFGIASMISWRGRWYVIHLGAVLRASAAGAVDDPSPGAGVAAASSTC